MIDSSGIGVYLKGCLPFFFSSPHNFLLCGDTKKLEPVSSGHANVKIIHCAIKTFSFRELFFFPSTLLHIINQTGCYYSPFFNIPGGITIPVYTTIHDIIFADMPGLTSHLGLAIRLFFYKRAFKLSKKIFTVSFFSKSRIEFHLGLSKPVVVTYSALQPYLLCSHSSPYIKNNNIIFIGNIKKHKGLDCLLEAFNGLKQEYPAGKGPFPYKLLIVGEQHNFRTCDSGLREKLSNADISTIQFIGSTDNEKLKELLSNAVLLVQPSLYEGFGLPPLEAMILGTRTLISDIPVFREIYSEFPVTFFRAGDCFDLKEKMRKILENNTSQALALPERLTSKYTFEKTASIILQEITGI
jgi:glycosyltransferase involved in cell wall biosynthesis